MSEAVAAIGKALDEALSLDWDGCPGDELAAALEEVEQLRRRVEALDLTVLGAFDRSGVWVDEGHRNATSWLVKHGKARRSSASHDLRVARRLRHMPATADALAGGDIGRDHVNALARARRDDLGGLFDDAEKSLVDNARTLSFDAFDRTVKYWVDAADPRGADEEFGKKIERRSLHLSETFDDMTRLDAWLDPLSAEEFRVEFERLEEIEFQKDWAEARVELGDEASALDLRRSPAQRRADALVEMARRSASTPIDSEGKPPRYIINLVMSWSTFVAELAAHQGVGDGDPVTLSDGRVCELESGTIVPPSFALPQALAGQVRRLVMGPEGHVLDFGRTKRFFDGGLREALILRDRTCDHEGCGLPARRCEADHRRSWGRDGPTSERNGRMYCKSHNLWKEMLERLASMRLGEE